MAGHTDETPEFLTTEEVAQRLRYSPRYVRKLIYDEDLGAVQLKSGGRWLVPYTEYKKYVAELFIQVR